MLPLAGAEILTERAGNDHLPGGPAVARKVRTEQLRRADKLAEGGCRPGIAQTPLRRPKTEPKQVSRYARAGKLSLILVGFFGTVVPTPLRRSVTDRADLGGRPQAREGPLLR